MGYIKIIQFGDKTIINKYEKTLPDNQRKGKVLSKLEKQRRKAIRTLATYKRSQFSINRAKTNFFRLCHHNNLSFSDRHISFFTFTFASDFELIYCKKRLSQFWSRLNKHVSLQQNSQIAYICVPERTKKKRWHFHALVYNLPPDLVQNERVSRTLQNLYRSGYLHVDLARDKSPKIAGYMAKYLSKYMQDNDNESKRAYTCSRNIEKVRIHGSNSFDNEILDLLEPNSFPRMSVYETKYLGTCQKFEYDL